MPVHGWHGCHGTDVRTLLTRFVRAPRVCTCTSTTTVEEVTYSTGIPAAMARVTSAE